MIFRVIYIVLIVLMFGGFIFHMLFRDSLVYMLHGYPPSIIGSGTPEDFEAARTTFGTSQLSFYLALGVAALCMIVSGVAIYRRVFIDYYINFIILALSIFLIVLYFAALTVPKRVV
jgi:cytochrome b subunit of formate dehydrogenase